MPLYHFDLIQRDSKELDSVGTECVSDDEAIQQAVTALAELLKDVAGPEIKLGYVVRRAQNPVAQIQLIVATDRYSSSDGVR
jgi:hypothetical protein